MLTPILSIFNLLQKSCEIYIISPLSPSIPPTSAITEDNLHEIHEHFTPKTDGKSSFKITSFLSSLDGAFILCITVLLGSSYDNLSLGYFSAHP